MTEPDSTPPAQPDGRPHIERPEPPPEQPRPTFVDSPSSPFETAMKATLGVIAALILCFVLLFIGCGMLVASQSEGATPSVRKCGAAGTTDGGVYATNVRARSVSCIVAREVARQSPGSGRLRFPGSALVWRCRVTAMAASSDGSVPGPRSTHVECRAGRSGQLVRYQLRS
jgi:hypothetical protein